MASTPILRTPDFTKQFYVATDASDRWIGGYLFRTVDGTEYPICYYFRVLHRYKKNYSTVEKECLSLLYAISKFKIYFGDSEVLTYTDSSPLVYLNRMANNNKRLERWKLILSEYNLNIKHKRGCLNTLADILSRPSESNPSTNPPDPS